MWTHPGKKLLFMGGEIAQRAEWNHDARARPGTLLDDPRHRGMQRLVHDLNAAYRRMPALHRQDADAAGLPWVIGDDGAQSVFAYLRFGAAGDPPALVVVNLTPVAAPRLPHRRAAGGRCGRRSLNSDAAAYGGSNSGNGGAIRRRSRMPAHGYRRSAVVSSCRRSPR